MPVSPFFYARLEISLQTSTIFQLLGILHHALTWVRSHPSLQGHARRRFLVPRPEPLLALRFPASPLAGAAA